MSLPNQVLPHEPCRHPPRRARDRRPAGHRRRDGRQRPAFAQNLTFELRATFFSKEVKAPKPIDPRVFVMDPAAKVGVGPQLIKHATGFRPAFVAGPTNVGACNADGQPLDFTIAGWFAARGTKNNFIADANGILLVYHSDNRDHGKLRGERGVNAHHQLIVSIPG